MRISDHGLQAGEQPVPCNAVDEIGFVETARRTIKTSAYVNDVQGVVAGQDGQILANDQARHVSTLCDQIARIERAQSGSR